MVAAFDDVRFIFHRFPDPARRMETARLKRASLFALREPIPRRVALAVTVGVFATLAVAWVVLSYGGFVRPLFLPTPTAVLERAVFLYREEILVRDIWISNVRVFSGFLMAMVVAIPLGMLAGNLPIFAAAVNPFMGFIRYMPVPAFIPLLVLYAGIDEAPKILLIFIGTVVQMTIMVGDVTRRVQPELIRAAMVLGADSREIFRKVIWRGSLPGIVDVLRINLGFAWTYLVVAELVAANEGMGFRILRSQRFLQTDTIFLYILLIGLLGILFDFAFRQLHRFAFPWVRERVRG
jgi:NitT/TauT family transport system permease protein